MSTPQSAGLLMYRHRSGVEVLLVHPGGPFWARRDAGAWSLPKGEYGDDEDALAAACREFQEETGFGVHPPFLSLGELRQRSGKRVTAWAFQGDADPSQLRSNTFEMEWPPRSGRVRLFTEADRAGWFGLDEARVKLLPAQVPFVDRLAELLSRT